MNIQRYPQSAILAAALAAGLCAPLSPLHAAQGARPHSAGTPYAARGIPDRVVLTPGADPAREMGVAFRTDLRQTQAAGEIALAIDGPNLAARTTAVPGQSFEINTGNGAARYHQLRFTGLSPDTAYLYRVQGADGWSEWHMFRTAADQFRPFTFLYFGDTQNGILEIGSRVIRKAFAATASPALALHAGDLVAQREEKEHDDEWGEWAQAGGHHFAMVPQLPAAGNHEYVDHLLPDGEESRLLGPHWPLSFVLPENGAAAVQSTTYRVDYQGVRFIVLDGTAALDLGAREVQSEWLEQQLAGHGARWTVVLMHQPIYTCARPQDTEALKLAWEPLFRRHDVDLVLQGHDHCYSRLSHAGGREAGENARQAGASQGPVYLVSVTGSKMYGLNDRAATQPDRFAEDTQLYQVVQVEADHLAFRAYTATGALYDGFDLQRDQQGNKRLIEQHELPAARRCVDTEGPDGVPCTSSPK